MSTCRVSSFQLQYYVILKPHFESLADFSIVSKGKNAQEKLLYCFLRENKLFVSIFLEIHSVHDFKSNYYELHYSGMRVINCYRRWRMGYIFLKNLLLYNIVIRKRQSGNTGCRLVVFIIFHFRCWINNKRPSKPTHHKFDSVATKDDFIYQHDPEVLFEILEEEKDEETQITLKDAQVELLYHFFMYLLRSIHQRRCIFETL